MKAEETLDSSLSEIKGKYSPEKEESDDTIFDPVEIDPNLIEEKSKQTVEEIQDKDSLFQQVELNPNNVKQKLNQVDGERNLEILESSRGR
mmetsp:Transcript_6475/g.12967  ORF Transcript_6475/g.12967 Transcript_6475/m.12967 type:complete len:91 (-) Transcript_6475:759-1031(-)